VNNGRPISVNSVGYSLTVQLIAECELYDHSTVAKLSGRFHCTQAVRVRHTATAKIRCCRQIDVPGWTTQRDSVTDSRHRHEIQRLTSVAYLLRSAGRRQNNATTRRICGGPLTIDSSRLDSCCNPTVLLSRDHTLRADVNARRPHVRIIV